MAHLIVFVPVLLSSHVTIWYMLLFLVGAAFLMRGVLKGEKFSTWGGTALMIVLVIYLLVSIVFRSQ